MEYCGGVPLRGWFFRADERSLGGTRWRPIGPFLTIILGLLWFLPPAFAEPQGAYPSPESLCLRVPQEQRQQCIAQNRASSQAYQQSLEQYRRQPRGAVVPRGTPWWDNPSSGQRLREEQMARSRQQAEEYRLKREQEREAQRIEREEKAEERRKFAEEREERKEALRRERALKREQREQERREEIAQQQEQARLLAVQRQEEQARQAEQYRQLQAEAAERVAEERAETFREANVLLRKLSWGMAALVVVLALIPAYRLYAPNRLMEFAGWRYSGFVMISSIAFGIFSGWWRWIRPSRPGRPI